jgi:translation initiation factor RLI1
MSLVTLPDLIILDEPTSALDVLTQANIFNVLKRIKQEMQTSFILITHDIATSSEPAIALPCVRGPDRRGERRVPFLHRAAAPVFPKTDGKRAEAAERRRPGVHCGTPTELDQPAGWVSLQGALPVPL